MTQQSTTKERANFRILLLVFVPVCGMGTIAQAKAVSRTATRYLYILNCDAILQKFDTVSRKQVSMTSLAKHSSLIPTHGGQANSVVDGCSTSGAAYQAKTALLYTVSPSTGSIEPGAIRHFRILSFHLPDLTPAAVINLPGKYNDGDSPFSRLIAPPRSE